VSLALLANTATGALADPCGRSRNGI
jgi:hypothetical protein